MSKENLFVLNKWILFNFILITQIIIGADISVPPPIETPINLSEDSISYREKICKSEKTCHLADLFPEQNDLINRNCMCDAACAEFGDCCKDSKYFKEVVQPKKYNCTDSQVYMITECPAKYKNTTIIEKCRNYSLTNADTKLILPVTNKKSNRTYANEYCAVCNGEKSYQPWALEVFCHPDDVLYTQEDPLFQTNSTSSAEDFDTMVKNAEKYMKFDKITKKFRSTYKGKNFTCSHYSSQPDTLKSNTRACRPTVSTCLANFNTTVVRRCQSYTSYAFYGVTIYKNQDCAFCNNVTELLQGCIGGAAGAAYSPASSLFTTGDKSGGADPCNIASAKDKFCS